jgi:hypothetical protein
VDLVRGLSSWAGNPLADSSTSVFPALYAMFLFLAYVMLYALTHLPRPEAVVAPSLPSNSVPA